MTDNLKIQDELSDLLCRDLLGELGGEGREYLDSLIARYALEEFDRESIIARLREKDPFDGHEVYRKLKRDRNQAYRSGRSWVWRVSIAASILLFFVAGLYLWKKSDLLVREVVVAEQIIMPGDYRAVITMGNGQEVMLGNGERNMEEYDGTVIRSRAGELEYTLSGLASAEVYNTLTIPRGGEYRLVLSDGTQVWLNAETRLRYPIAFSGHLREVFLEGEAYFQVARDEDVPFVVHTSMGKVRVLGTSFNVRDYADEREVVTTLLSGKVVYCSDDQAKDSVVLVPELQSVDRVHGPLVVTKVNPFVASGWKDGKYVFEDESLEDIMRTLERWYDIEVVFEDSRLKQLHFTGDLERYEDILVFLRFIETGGDVKFRIEGKTVKIDKK